MADNVVVGDGWQAILVKAPPRHIGSLTIGGALAEFSGDEQVLTALFEKLHWKTLRGGG